MDRGKRIPRNNMFIEIIEILSQRSTCERKKVGALLTKSNRIIATGYNGTLPLIDPNYGIDKDGNSRTVHAEANIISFCARNGVKTNNTRLYITLSPCEKCAELIVQAGIKEVYYLESYRDKTGIMILTKQGVKCHLITKL